MGDTRLLWTVPCNLLWQLLHRKQRLLRWLWRGRFLLLQWWQLLCCNRSTRCHRCCSSLRRQNHCLRRGKGRVSNVSLCIKTSAGRAAVRLKRGRWH